MKTMKSEFKKGDVLAQIEDPFFNHWEVMDDDGFYYVLKRSRTDGVGEVQVGVSKGAVEQRYVRIDGGE